MNKEGEDEGEESSLDFFGFFSRKSAKSTAASAKNGVYMYGGVGTGKTTIMVINLGNFIKRKSKVK